MNMLSKTKKFLLGLCVSVFAALPFVSAADSWASGSFLAPIVDVLNGLANAISGGNAQAIAYQSGVQPWHIIGLTFVFVTAVVAAALKFIKIFEKKMVLRLP